ncbi:MAG: tetratricopeptide repeat protein [Myxococcota bacterium]
MLRRTILALLHRAPCGCVIFAFLATACPDGQLADARRLAQAGRTEEAGAAFVALAKADPANLAAWDGAVQLWCHDQINVGECMSVLDLELQLLGNLQRHRDTLSEVLERRARARLAQGMVDAALTDLERAIKAAPERATVYTARARAFMMMGRSEEGRLALRTARKLQPKLTEIDELYRSMPAADTATISPSPGTDEFGGPR